jgi:mannitol/fructose-specific phosphotransferase system IIA component (Ntr-type)/nucleotide-binding universal stress UspA family protein
LLREMALREVANDLEQKDKEQRQSPGSTASSEKVMVAITDEPSAASLIRYGSRMAGRVNAKLYVVHVDSANASQRTPELERSLTENIRLGKLLGAKIVELRDSDVVRSLERFAREEGITHILLGSTQRSWWERIFARSVVSQLLRSIGEIAIHVLPLKADVETIDSAPSNKSEFRFSTHVPVENILPALRGIVTVEQTIAILMDHLVRLYPSLSTQRSKLLEAVLKRERLMSTFLDSGIAIPHAAGLEEITELRAVMALLPEGVTSLGRDKKASIVLLFISPEVGRSDHLKFLAATAGIFGDETTVREIAGSSTAEDAFDLIIRSENLNSRTR